MLHDLRHAGRLLLKAPGFAALAVLTLALGIAASTAMFSLADAVVLAPLPYDDPASRVMIWNRWRGFDKTWVNPAEARAWKERCPSLADVAHWQVDRANLTGEGEALRVGAGFVSANTFEVLGARPLLGRAFTPEEDRFGGPRVAVLGHSLWQGRFGGETSVLGRTVSLDGEPHVIVGVMPPGFALPTDFGEDAAEPTQVYVPRAPEPDELMEFGSHGDHGAARLVAGATAARATEELRAAMDQLTAEGRYDRREHHQAFAVPLADEILGPHRPAVAVVGAASILLLLVACANVASLLLARAAGRQRELALRAAVGAGRGRLLRQLLVEGLVLALLATAVGLPLARATLRALSSTVAAQVPRAAAASIDPRATGFALLLAVFTTVVFALAPALEALRQDVAETLREGGPRSAGGRLAPPVAARRGRGPGRPGRAPRRRGRPHGPQPRRPGPHRHRIRAAGAAHRPARGSRGPVPHAGGRRPLLPLGRGRGAGVAWRAAGGPPAGAPARRVDRRFRHRRRGLRRDGERPGPGGLAGGHGGHGGDARRAPGPRPLPAARRRRGRPGRAP